jgi:hypothetical protein
MTRHEHTSAIYIHSSSGRAKALITDDHSVRKLDVVSGHVTIGVRICAYLLLAA